MEEQRLINIEQRLAEHGRKLDAIQELLREAVRHAEQIRGLREDVATLTRKHDALVEPNEGTIAVIRDHQASCPRGQLKFLWTFVIGMALAFIGFAGTALHFVSDLAKRVSE